MATIGLMRQVNVDLRSVLQQESEFRSKLTLPRRNARHTHKHSSIMVVNRSKRPRAMSTNDSSALRVFVNRIHVIRYLVRRFRSLLISFARCIILFRFDRARNNSNIVRQRVQGRLAHRPLCRQDNFQIVTPNVRITTSIHMVISTVLNVTRPIPYRARRPSRRVLRHKLIRLVTKIGSMSTTYTHPIMINRSRNLSYLSTTDKIFNMLHRRLPPSNLRTVFTSKRSRRKYSRLHLRNLNVIFHARSLLRNLGRVIVVGRQLTTLRSNRPVATHFNKYLTQRRLIRSR